MLTSSIAFAQQAFKWEKATSNGYNYTYVSGDPTHSRFYKLKNGLTVILSTTKQQPRIQSYIAVKAGSKTDPADHTGLAHYLEHLMFKGTDRYGSLNWSKESPLLDQIDNLYEQYNSTKDEAKRKEIYKKIDQVSGEAAKFAIANEYDKMMAAMGGQNTNAFTSFEQTVYTDDIPSASVDKYLTLQAERFRKPIFRIFHTELEAVYEEKNRGLDNDGSKVFEAMFAALFPNNNYGRQTTIGTVEHLKNPSLKAIRNYFHNYYVPNNMGVIMTGDFNPDVMIKKIDQRFGYMAPKAVPAYTFAPEKPITAPVKRDIYGPTPENLTIAFRFPGASTRDARMLNLLGDILTNGKAGLFDLDLTKKQRLLSANATSYNLKDYSVLMLQGSPIKGQTLDTVRSLMLAEIAKLKSGKFSDDLIPAIVNNSKKSKIQGNENYVSRAGNLMSAFTSGVDWRNEVANEDELSKITKPQIVAFANKYLNDNNYVIVYKHLGEDKNIVKVDKPTITPVAVNREAQSDFLKTVNNMPSNQVQPTWLDFNRDIKRANAGPLEVLSVQNKDNSLFRLYYRYDMGSWNNKLLPIAAQYLQFLGTDKMSAEDISKAFYKLAASFSVNTGTDVSTVSINGLQENFDKTVALYEDLIKNCKPDEAALASLKARIRKGRENARLNKAAIMSGLLNYARYGAQNPFNYTLSNEELDNLKAEDLVNLLHSLSDYKHTVLYYGPQAAPAQAIAALHKVPSTFKAYPAAKQFTRVNPDKNQVLFADFDMVQAEINWIRNESPYDVAKTPVIELYNNYFGGGMSSIVFQTIRESKALAYSTYAVYVAPSKKEDPNYFIAYVGTQADKLNEAIKGMNELITDLPESEKVVNTARDNIRKSLETDRVTQDGILFSYLNAQRRGLDYDERKNTYNAVANLDYAALKAFHDQEIKNKPFTYCIVASEKRVKDSDLKAYGELTKLSLNQLFGY